MKLLGAPLVALLLCVCPSLQRSSSCSTTTASWARGSIALKRVLGMMIQGIYAGALLGAAALPVSAQQEASTHAERLLEARALAPERVLLLRGHFVNDALRDPVQIRFDAQGRLHADYGGMILRDVAYDGERAWSVDGAGRPYELGGTQRDLLLALHGLLCGNWLSALEWELEPIGSTADGRLRARLVGRHVELELELDDEDLPRRVEFETFGRDRSLRFLDWRAGELGRWPGRVELRDGPRLVGTFAYESLTESEEATFGPPEDPGFDVHFDLEAEGELTVRRIASGHMFVRADIDGKDVGWFAFDTGAGRSVIDARVAKRLGLEVLIDGLRSTGAGGPAGISVRRAHDLRLGPLTWRRPVLAATDLSALERSFGVAPLAGLLGAELWSQAVWEYDIAGARIVAHPVDHAPQGATWVPVEIEEGKLIAPVQFEGHTGRFIIDTGGGAPLYFNAPTVERLDLLEGRSTRRTSVRGVGGLATVRQGPIGEVLLGDRSYQGLSAIFTSSDVQGSWCDPYIDGIAGIALLRSGPVWFDYPGRRIGLVKAR